MRSKLDPRALGILQRVLRGGPWQESSWEGRTRQFGTVLLETLRESLATHQVATSVAAAYTAARNELPLGSPAYHETWARVALVWAARELVRAAYEDPAADEKTRNELMRVAGEIVAAADQLSKGEAPAWPTERVVNAAREGLERLKERVILDGDAAIFLATYLHQFKHVVPLLAAGRQSTDSLVRGTVIRIDRWAREDGLHAWSDAPLAARQAWAKRVLYETSFALADAVPHEYGGEEQAKQACLWLARMACQVAARAERVSEFVPTVPGEGTPKKPPVEEEARDKPPSQRTAEVSMDKKDQILKTLETDATDAAWRLAGSQFVKLAREPIVAFLSRQLNPDDESLRGKIAAFLDSELGEALLSSMLSLSLSMLPNSTGDVPQRLAKELRVRAMTDAGDVVADLLMGPLRQVAVLYLQNVNTQQPQQEPASLPAERAEPPVKVPSVESESRQSQQAYVGAKDR